MFVYSCFIENTSIDLEPTDPSFLRWFCHIDLFGKCGCMASAKEAFNGMAVKDVYSWTSMASAYAKCGDLENAAWLFEDMQGTQFLGVA
jgi:pentatricopeptide repeat protein